MRAVSRPMRETETLGLKGIGLLGLMVIFIGAEG